MPYLWNGVDLFQQCEWGGNCDKHAISNSNYRLNGQTLAAAGRAPVATTAGYLYSGETFTPTGYMLKGAQVVLQKAGCRPRINGAQLYHQTNAGTYYINRFTDGEVWVSTTANSRTGTIISNSDASLLYPHGIRYVMLRIVGGGGRGGNGSLPWNVGGGGGGGATAVCCVRLPVNGNVRIIVGAVGSPSGIECDTFFVSANGGGNGGSGSTTGGSGGSVSGGTQSADGILLASASGGSGGGYYNAGGGSSISFTDYAPEGGSISWLASGGSSGSGTGGGGGASTCGQGGRTDNGNLNNNGSMGNGPGAGGSGGNYSSGTGGAGSPGAATIWY